MSGPEYRRIDAAQAVSVILPQMRQIGPGIAVVLTMAVCARLATLWLPSFAGEVLVGMLAGLAAANIGTLPSILKRGVKVSSSTFLRAGIVLLGAQLSVGDAVQTWSGAAVNIVTCVAAVALMMIILTRLLRLPPRLAALIGVGTAICGNSAIVATAPVIQAKDSELTFAVATITLFGTAAALAYPLVGLSLGMPDLQYGLWVGLSVNDTSQVTAASFAFSEAAGETATVVKVARNSLIGPAIVVIGVVYPWLAGVRRESTDSLGKALLRSVPLFVVGFIALMILNSVGAIAPTVADGLYGAAKFLILAAMVALGLQTDLRGIQRIGFKPLWAGLTVASTLTVIALVLASASDQ